MDFPVKSSIQVTQGESCSEWHIVMHTANEEAMKLLYLSTLLYARTLNQPLTHPYTLKRMK